MCSNSGQTSSWWMTQHDSEHENNSSFPFFNSNLGEPTHSLDDLWGPDDDTFFDIIGFPPTSGEMLKPDNCEGKSPSSQMTNQLPPNGGYFSQNAEDSSFIRLDGEGPNSVFNFFGTTSPYLDTSPYLVTSTEEVEPGTSCSKEEEIVYPGADMHTLYTHLQECQNPNPSDKNKAPRRKSMFFTINEVEALVQAVLRHGPGRWKMIKDEAFRNDSRRTLTDLRDKWRSLVKTANLPAHKRRGVVPPEWLLERVRYVVENGMQIPPAS